MRVRFGFVAMSKDLPSDSPSRTTPRARLRSDSREQSMRRLSQIAAQNIESSLRVMHHAAQAGIPLYRFSSGLVPFLGQPDTQDWDLLRYLGVDFSPLGSAAREAAMRVSFHPDQTSLLSAERQEERETAQRTLEEHDRLCDAMGLGPDAILIVHMGGANSDKPAAAQRFSESVQHLPRGVRSRLVIENDDTAFTARDVLQTAADTGLPVVLDLLHDRCNPSRHRLEDLLVQAFATWEDRETPPKVHLSSHRDLAEPRTHAEEVVPGDCILLLDAGRKVGLDFDVMLEAKATDHALLRLIEAVSQYPGVERVSGGTIVYRGAREGF